MIGDRDHPIDGMAETLAWTGDERFFEFRDENLSLGGCTHEWRDGEHLGRAEPADALVWIWGNVLGFEGADGYRPRDPDGGGSAADFCARLYGDHGSDFVAGLNGDFVGIVYDRERERVSVFTDRLGSWKLYFTRLDDGSIVFSSRVQSLAEYPPVSLEFDERYVVQHLALRGPYGVKTPLRGVEMFPPGAVTTYDLETNTLERDEYWRPRFDPIDEPYEHFVDEFVERFRASINERTQDTSRRYGLLLSGGSDARLVLGALDDDLDVTAFHMADWMNKEARIAERIAMTAGVEFRLLRRGPAYFEGLLERTPAMWNFDQLFNKAWAEGFMDEIRSDVDVLLTGHFCDTMFKGWQVPTHSVSLGPLGPFDLPVERSISSVDEVVEEMTWPDPEYIDTELSISESLRREIYPTDGGVAWFGLEFDSLDDLVLGKYHYPATTDSFFRQSLRENLPLQMPALDNRLMELWLTMPTRYQLRHNVVNAAVESIDPELAAIPHASSGVPVGRSRSFHRLGSLPMNALRRLSPFDAPPKEHLNHGPWGPHGDLIRHTTFVEEALSEEDALVRSLPFLDREGVWECHERHLEGEDCMTELYRLVTFLKAPVTRKVLGSSGVDSGEPARRGVADEGANGGPPR